MFKVSDRLEHYFIGHSGPLHADPHGLNSYQELSAWAAAQGLNASMPVYAPTDEEVALSIFRTRDGAMTFQAWHDRRHVLYQAPFDLKGENELALQHMDELLKANMRSRDAAAIYHLIYGRNAYYFNNGHRVVANASDFVCQALIHGVEYASRRRDELYQQSLKG